MNWSKYLGAACVGFAVFGCNQRPSEATAPVEYVKDNVSAVAPISTSVEQVPVIHGDWEPVRPTTFDMPTKEPEAPTPPPKDEVWYIAAPKLKSCVKVSDSYAGLESPDDVIRFAADSNVQLIPKFNGQNIVTLSDATGQEETIGMVRGHDMCIIVLKMITK